ncbi:unnamed protein product [Spodoptera littoralis]|uniref:Uncharacterized protein n=1 Tax=Spodoptera littoralis TaxID=7109 RepID=A0A9P0I457_SPOLI|nr:unnamed protein product [Spodoptera littoralis]CAH1640773.1 unnamed protein product [Spodoptera littoralis]
MLFLFLLILISNSSAELFSFKNFVDNDNNVTTDTQYKLRDLYKYNNRGDPLWVLSLSGDDWMNPTLRLGSSKELDDFFQYIGPLMRITRGRFSARVKKNDPNKANSNEDSQQAPTQKDFMKMINKFTLSSSVDPDAYITDNNQEYDSPTITIHFKGQNSVLLVSLGSKQWHYIINSRSLPEWFYETHDTTENPLPLPDDVKIQFFNSLWRLLHLMFGFPA